MGAIAGESGTTHMCARWTENAVEVLKRRWLVGDDARGIADELGMTRNAVIGKAWSQREA